ncbi:MAG: hypothetical protein U0172_07850 [Nitrospiraceae bacterium]
MTNEILRAYQEVEQAMERYNKLLAEYVNTQHTGERSDPTKFERVSQGARAMRDSSLIYLSYAKFVAHGMPESPDMIEEDIQG